MRIGRTLPPAAAPISLKDICNGLLGAFTGSAPLARFENELREHYQVRHAFLLSSGKAALAVILMALKELDPEKDEVLISGYTCYSVPAAIVRAGLRVRVCDIDPQTLDFDWGRMEQEIKSPRLLAVVSTHLFGLPADVSRLKEMAAARDITVIEDAAQAMGGEVDAGKLGTLGDVGLFSLGRGKALSTVSGGVIISNNADLGEAIAQVVERLPGQGPSDVVTSCCYAFALWLLVKPRWYWLPKALPFLKLGETVFDPSFEMKRMGNFPAGVAKGWQIKLKRFREERWRHAAALIAAGLDSAATSAQGLPNLIKFPVLAASETARERLVEKSERVGLGITKCYPEAITGIPELTSHLSSNQCPEAEKVARTLVTLPVHHFVKEQDIEKLVLYAVERQSPKSRGLNNPKYRWEQ